MPKEITAKKGDVITVGGRKWSVDALESFRNYQKKYIKDYYIGFTFRFNKEKDKDIIKKIKSQKNKKDGAAGYIRRLIVQDIKKNGIK